MKSPLAIAAFNAIDRLFKLITWTAVTGVVFIAYQKSGDWLELILLVFMTAMIVIGTLSVAVMGIDFAGNAMPAGLRGTRLTRLVFYAVALIVMAGLAFGLTSAIHTLVLKL